MAAIVISAGLLAMAAAWAQVARTERQAAARLRDEAAANYRDAQAAKATAQHLLDHATERLAKATEIYRNAGAIREEACA